MLSTLSQDEWWSISLALGIPHCRCHRPTNARYSIHQPALLRRSTLVSFNMFQFVVHLVVQSKYFPSGLISPHFSLLLMATIVYTCPMFPLQCKTFCCRTVFYSSGVATIRAIYYYCCRTRTSDNNVVSVLKRMNSTTQRCRQEHDREGFTESYCLPVYGTNGRSAVDTKVCKFEIAQQLDRYFVGKEHIVPVAVKVSIEVHALQKIKQHDFSLAQQSGFQ